MFDNKTILVTGGTGSFGKEFIKTILSKYKPKKIIIFSRDELKQYEMQNSDFFKPHVKTLRYFIGDVRDLPRLKMAMNKVDFVIHAAALKQVPAAEYNPFEAVKTNIIGAQNVIDSCLSGKVRKVIALSTDKAAAPINLYGATKLASDKLFIAANNYSGDNPVKFSVVRYGNVFGSRGSVVPYFLKIKKTGTFPVTDDRMTRFSITLNDGANFVLNCFDKMCGGEIFIPKISSYRILDIAKAISPDSQIKLTGIRPGEKLHEEMITQSDSMNTIDCGDYYVILPSTSFLTKEQYDKSNNIVSESCSYGFSYNSKNNKVFLNIDEIKKLVKNTNFK